jgi:hypothetical protein
MSFRIVKKEKGFIVEKQEKKFGITYWVPYVKSSGLDCAWHHSTYGYALMNLIDQVKKDLIYIDETINPGV